MIMDDNKMVEQGLGMFFKPGYHNKYREKFKSYLGRAKCPEKKNKLLKVFIEEVGVLEPEALLMSDPKVKGNLAPIPATKPVSDCPRCPKGKSRELKVTEIRRED
jgi:hypothetical protein